MKIRVAMLVLAACFAACAALADEVSDALAKASDLYKAKKYVEAKAEMEKALTAIAPLAHGQYPKPEVKGGTYVNYEFSFRITRPEKDWELAIVSPTGSAAGGTTPFCQLTYSKADVKSDEAVICYVRDLKALYGAKYDTAVKGHEKEFLKIAGQKMATSVAQLSDQKVTGQTELTIGGNPAVRTDYSAKKGDRAMKCFTVDVLRGALMFTSIFVEAESRDKEIAPAFKQIVDSIDLSPVAIPEKGPEKGK